MAHGEHRIQARTFRPDPATYATAQRAVKAVNPKATMNDYMVAFVQWLALETDELPERPTREALDRALADAE
ncbi:hypothetical protein [Streptomyces sp. NPDC057677]|uniref:hypothetical protein n=1 Tax=unclassified Streptomyces TaxID=2593676 RepID=UPI0036C4F8FA